MFGSTVHAAHAYRRLAIESAALGADRHQLVGLMFTGTLAAIAQARTALARGDMAAKADASGRAVRLVSEGLKASVDRSVGEVGESLYQLWDYCVRRLLFAHLKRDDEAYGEVATLVAQISDAWNSIGPQAAAALAERSAA